MKEIEGKELEHGFEPISIIKPLFMEQMKNFIAYQSVVAILVLGIQIVARIVVHDVDFITCDDDGMEWLYSSHWGEAFAVLHTIIICMQGVMVERVFYSVPHHMKYFEYKVELGKIHPEQTNKESHQVSEINDGEV